MKFIATPLQGATIIQPSVLADERGFFFRYFCKEEFSEIGHTAEWVQLNHSFTANTGAIRGMHYQLPPHSEIKMVRCIAGRVWDVIVDIRRDSPTFLNWFGVELSAENKNMIYIPQGFAHGFQTLTTNCELLYHHSAFYSKESERGIRYDDPLIGIDWLLTAANMSERDRQHPLLTTDFAGI